MPYVPHTDPRVWFPTSPPAYNNEHSRSARGYLDVVNSHRVMGNPRYAPRGGDTFCNIFLWDCTRALGCEVPHYVDRNDKPVAYNHTEARELTANDVCDWLRLRGEAYGWRRVVEESDVRALIKDGHPVVAVWKNPTAGGHGHAGMVLPTADDEELQVAQAGAKCYARQALSVCFPRITPVFYAHK